MNDADRPSSVLVVGAGLIGTSVALALRRQGVRVFLDDVDSENLEVAVARGAGQPVDHAADPEVVVVAVPPRYAAQVLATVSRDYPRAALTDVTSVKAPVLNEAVRLGSDPHRLVGGHPMAGREVAGAVGARSDLFDGRVWILTPDPRVDRASVHRVRMIAELCGGTPVEMSASDHDRAVALVSHAPQVVASVLAGRLLTAGDGQVQIAGQGLRDMTRIADSSPSLWTDVLAANAEPVADVIQAIAEDLMNLVTDLRAGSADSVRHAIVRGNEGKARIPGKHGAAPRADASVTVMLADRPGELARLFTAAAQANVNTEDVRIDHVLGRPSGLVDVIVAPESVDRLAAALRAVGFDVRA